MKGGLPGLESRELEEIGDQPAETLGVLQGGADVLDPLLLAEGIGDCFSRLSLPRRSVAAERAPGCDFRAHRAA
jgi:hypothetical protein